MVLKVKLQRKQLYSLGIGSCPIGCVAINRCAYSPFCVFIDNGTRLKCPAVHDYKCQR